MIDKIPTLQNDQGKLTKHVLPSTRTDDWPLARALHFPLLHLGCCSAPRHVSRLPLSNSPRHANIHVSPELGIDAEFKNVDLLEGANFDPEFLKLVSDIRSFSLPFVE